MKLAIISNAPIVIKNGRNYLYAPYLKELKLWGKNVESIEFCCPTWNKNETLLVEEILDTDFNYTVNKTHDFDIKSIKNIIKTLLFLPINFIKVFNVMKKAEHIHLRCPGNLGLIGCIVQIIFPSIPKTTKYAGNWDPISKQPWSYKLQKWILNNTFLTKNMQVLVYGEWEGSSKNIKSFFTATYTDQDAKITLNLPVKKLPILTTDVIKFMFVGTLNPGKNPLFAIQIFKELISIIKNAELHFYGDGIMREELKQYVLVNNLENKVILHGNQPKEVVEEAYRNNHFLILASKSEGWPKVVAEAMFWGCVPLSTNVSCVKQMMGNGDRGLLLHFDINTDLQNLINIINNPVLYSKMSDNGKNWSSQYTIDKFEQEIKNLLWKK